MEKIHKEEVLQHVIEEKRCLVRRRDGHVGHNLWVQIGNIDENIVQLGKVIDQIVEDVGCGGYADMKTIAQNSYDYIAASDQSND